MRKIDWYDEFVNRNYRPKKREIVALFRYGATGISSKEAVGRIASESSVGTWTTLPGMPVKQINKLKAIAFWYNKEFAKIAYPLELWERGSIPQLMTGIAGNIFGMKALKNLRLIDASLPREYLKEFKGAVYGKEAIKKIFKKRKGPITATVIKPKLGYTAEQHAKLAYEIYLGGIDCVKDDENLTDLKFNRFNKRVELVAKARDKAEKETKEIKDAFINVTAPNLKELERRIRLVHDFGFRYFMIDVVISGFTAVQTAAELAKDYKMAIHAHRAMHAAFTRSNKHGISMLFLAKLFRIIGVDNIHIGTIVGKMAGSENEIIAMKEMLLSKKVKGIPKLRLEQNFYHIRPILPVASGGLHPGILPVLFDAFGTTDIAIQVGGGVLGHPQGAEAGAKAVCQAIEAYHRGIKLEEYAKKHKELREALEKWGTLRPM
ncbi:MAG: type III ribulose-bisphosphate carboxylase [Candidatus Diapherotrites archaeon]|nr:type III ribulose-bisphosphate carboxylase [Candidatus Diapherotrites archaeon]